MSIFAILVLIGAVYERWQALICRYPSYNSVRGWSPIHWVYSRTQPENFLADFSGGIQILGSSLAMWVYPISFELFSIPPEITVEWVILFEYVALFIGTYFLCHALFPKPQIALITLVFFAFSLTEMRDINFARFHHPNFWGLYYNFADAARLLAVACFFTRKLRWAGFWTAIAFTIHPVQGIILAVFLASASLQSLKDLNKQEILFGALTFLVIVGGWVGISIGAEAVSGSEIPLDIWMKLSYHMNHHWFPQKHGIFTKRFIGFLLPVLTLLIVSLYYQARHHSRERKILEFFFGILGLFLISMIGVFAAYDMRSPFLIKLCLFRASELIVLLLLPFYLHGLWKDWCDGNYWKAVVAGALLVLPAISQTDGYCFLLATLIVLPLYIPGSLFQGFSFIRWTAIGVHLCSLILLLVYSQIGWVRSWDAIELSGGPVLRNFIWILILGVGLFHLIARQWKHFPLPAIKGALLICFLFFPIQESSRAYEQKTLNCEGGDFMEAQLWARDHTAQDALFLYDPSEAYGWRDYSRRSSFGNAREWLHAGWLYDSNPKIYFEGLRRAAVFGFILEEYFGEDAQKTFNFQKFKKHIRKIFYESDQEWFVKLREEHGIDYVVFQKAKMKRMLPGFQRVFENDTYVIIDIRENQKE